MEKKFFSLIVPMYNMEKYIERCLNSIRSQTFKEFEVLLVDDGSTDSTYDICKKYIKNDDRFNLYRKENGGLSDARNFGMKLAEGEYVAFIDSDDYIEKDALLQFYNVLIGKQIDVLCAGAKKIENNVVTYINSIDNIEKCSGAEYMIYILKNGDYCYAACFNMYNRNFLLDNELFFKKGRLHEDEEWTPRVLLKAKKVGYLKYSFYNYEIREGSITQEKNKTSNALHIIMTCDELKEEYANINNQQLKMLLNENLVEKYLYAFQLGKLYDKKYNNLFDKSFLLNNAVKKRTRRKVRLFRMSRHLYYWINFLSKRRR